MQTTIKPEYLVSCFKQLNLRKDVLWALSVAVLCGMVTALWFFFDHHYPVQDEAGHILNSLAFRQLLLKLRPWSLHWWYDCLTVTRYYPPSVHISNAMLMLIFGTGRWVESLAASLYSALLAITVFGTTRLLKGTPLAAAIAALVINMFPEVTLMSHSYMLDLPLLSMVSLGIMTLLWWRQSPTWSRTIVCGVAIGYACLSKQIAVIYLFPAGIAVSLQSMLCSSKESIRKLAAQVVAIAGITMAITLPYVLVNYAFVRDLVKHASTSFAALHVEPTFVGNLSTYAGMFVSDMSPILFGVFLLACIVLNRQTQLTLIPVSASAAGGYLLMSMWPTIPDLRYLLPAMIAPAVYLGFLLASFACSGKPVRQSAVAILGVLLALQYVSLNFYPYPLTGPPVLADVRFGALMSSSTGSGPTPESDWGLFYVLNTIRKIDKDSPVFLNVFVNAPQLNAHSFQLWCKEQRSSIRPTTSLVYANIADRVEFSPKTSMYYHWFLFKTGAPSFPLFDQESVNNYNRQIRFVEHSGKFYLAGQRLLPDGSHLLLYRQT